MALIENTIYGLIDKEKIAVDRIRMYDPIANGWMDDPYYVAYSGGKDSDVIRILFQLSGVRHELVHNLTTADAPETVNYVKSIPNIRVDYPDISMWELIPKRLMPPTRIVRYCCEYLKERGGTGRIVSTGVRWDESHKRSKRGIAEIQAKKINDRLILNSDNDENRRIFEACHIKGKKVVNPIIDWTNSDVWEFLDHYGCLSNPLYQCGFNRVGCIGCPLAGKNREFEFEMFPKYKAIYINTYGRMIEERNKKGLATEWKNGEDVFDWCMDDKNLYKQIPGQFEWEEMTD